MTISELYKQVAQLGFEDSLEDNDRFFFASNRALLQVNSIQPAISACVINHRPLENVVENPSFNPVEVYDDLMYEATDVKSYYFEADGNGVLYIERFNRTSGEWDTVSTVTITTNVFTAFKGFIKSGTDFVVGLVRLRFSGDYLYTVKNVAMYKYIYSDSTSDIPAYEAYTKYDISARVSDFMSLDSPPIKEGENRELLNRGYEVEDGRYILLPYEAKGCYKVTYQRRPVEIESDESPSDSDTAIDLNSELCSMLPLLVAAYVWVEDEPEKSEYYLALYRERAMDYERRHRDVTPVAIKNRNGW